MTRRTIGLLVILALAILMTLLAADAQQATTVHRIGQLIAGNPPAGPDPSMAAFRQGLRDLGYVDGQNLVIERRSAEDSTERFPHLAVELVRQTRAAQYASYVIIASTAFALVLALFDLIGRLQSRIGTRETPWSLRSRDRIRVRYG